MDFLWQYAPHLAAMAVLLGLSAFFSCSEAALFYLGRDDRRAMQISGAGQRAAANLLNSPERLLSAILFWNLAINIAFFALTSVVGIHLEKSGRGGEAGIFALGALLVIILVSEMLPKNIAVLRPRVTAGLLGLPLAVAVRALDSLMPTVRFVNRASRRVLFPRFQAEPYLELGDLERAITLGTQDAALAQQEHRILQNIVALSETQVEEIMRPRLTFSSFQPPVSLGDLGGRVTPSGYVLITERDGDEVAGAIPLTLLSDIPTEHLEHYAEKVTYVPWCASVATALEDLRRWDRSVAVVINEHGETIGIITLDDILETVVRVQSSRSDRVLHTASIKKLDDNAWTVTGMSTLRRLSKRLSLQLPATKSVTVAGVLQEQLQRLPQEGDTAEWGGLRFTVLLAPERGQLSVRVERMFVQEQES